MDYMEIFTLVALIQSIRGVLALAVVWNWEVDTVNVKKGISKLKLASQCLFATTGRNQSATRKDA